MGLNTGDECGGGRAGGLPPAVCRRGGVWVAYDNRHVPGLSSISQLRIHWAPGNFLGIRLQG